MPTHQVIDVAVQGLKPGRWTAPLLWLLILKDIRNRNYEVLKRGYAPAWCSGTHPLGGDKVPQAKMLGPRGRSAPAGAHEAIKIALLEGAIARRQMRVNICVGSAIIRNG